MAISSISTVRTNLAAAVAVISGLRTSATIRDAINPPIFIVGAVNQDFDETMGRGTDALTIACHLYVSRADDKAGQTKLDGYLAGSGASSIKTKIEADRTLSGACATLRVVSQAGYAYYAIAGTDYLGAEFTVRVWG